MPLETAMVRASFSNSLEPSYACRIPDSLVTVPLTNTLSRTGAISEGGKKSIQSDSSSSEDVEMTALRITKFQNQKVLTHGGLNFHSHLFLYKRMFFLSP